jgi:hypothetical protein
MPLPAGGMTGALLLPAASTCCCSSRLACPCWLLAAGQSAEEEQPLRTMTLRLR